MEVEFERKLITLENSVRDIDERLAELYRETAGLSLQKSVVLQKVLKDTAASKRHAEEVRRARSELKTDLEDVSGKLARIDDVIEKLGAMRRSARTEKAKEFAELSASVLNLNKKVNKLAKDAEEAGGPKNAPDPRVDAFHSELRSAMDSIKSLEKKLESLQQSVSAAAKPRDLPKPDLSRVDAAEKKIEDVRLRANTVLKEMYDNVDSLKSANAEMTNKLGVMERKMTEMPKVSADGKTDVSGILDGMEELRGDVSTLSKGIEISRMIAEELKKTQTTLSAVESWKSRTEELPRELERLAERLAAVEQAKGGARDDIDMKNLKLAVAELSNKNRLINELALENVKIGSRLLVIEERLKSLSK